MSFVKDDEEQVKVDRKGTVAESAKINPLKKKQIKNRIKRLDPTQIIDRLPILLVPIKAGSNLYKLKKK